MSETQTQNRKRGRPEKKRIEFAIHNDYKKTKEFYQKCRSGEIKFETRIWDQESYVADCKHPRDATTKLFTNPVAYREVMYEDSSGKKIPSGKFHKNVFHFYSIRQFMHVVFRFLPLR